MSDTPASSSRQGACVNQTATDTHAEAQRIPCAQRVAKCVCMCCVRASRVYNQACVCAMCECASLVVRQAELERLHALEEEIMSTTGPEDERLEVRGRRGGRGRGEGGRVMGGAAGGEERRAARGWGRGNRGDGTAQIGMSGRGGAWMGSDGQEGLGRGVGWHGRGPEGHRRMGRGMGRGRGRAVRGRLRGRQGWWKAQGGVRCMRVVRMRGRTGQVLIREAGRCGRGCVVYAGSRGWTTSNTYMCTRMHAFAHA